jgi:hypothetical protein
VRLGGLHHGLDGDPIGSLVVDLATTGERGSDHAVEDGEPQSGLHPYFVGFE